jgi:SAM-dependent methyltransferase
MFSSRTRALVQIFLQEFIPVADEKIYLTEHKSTLFEWFKLRFPNLVGSEFLGRNYLAGEMVNGTRNENLEGVSFDNEEFKFVICADTLNHVMNYKKAIKEVFRILKPGGFFVFTAKVDFSKRNHTVRSEYKRGKLINYMEPEYYGDPLNPTGSLCLRYFGLQILDELKTQGFLLPQALQYWSNDFGYYGDDQVIFVAQRHSK